MAALSKNGIGTVCPSFVRMMTGRFENRFDFRFAEPLFQLSLKP